MSLKFSDFCNFMNVDEEKARPLSEVIAKNIIGDFSEENDFKKRKNDERSFDNFNELPSSYKEFFNTPKNQPRTLLKMSQNTSDAIYFRDAGRL